MLIDIDKIIIKDRIRKDYGNIEELANDIRDNGLINPPVVTEKDGELILIAGERRTRACKYLDYRQIEVRVMTVKDALHQLKLEISENENRKDFSYSEKMQWAEQLREEYSKIAKENQLSGLKKGDTIPVPSMLTERDNKGETRDKIAKDLDMSAGSLSKAQYIWNNADEEMIKELDEGKLSINKAYNTLKDKLKQQEEKNQELRQALDREKNKHKEKEIIEIDNTDYALQSKLKKIEKELEEKEIESNRFKTRLELMTDKAEAYKQDSEDYKKMKEDITYLTKQKDDLGRQIQSITDISGLVVEIDHLVKEKLAPVRYSKSLLEAKDDEIVLRNLTDIVQVVQQWCDEIKEYIPNKINYVEVIE